jgi:hypothetical protein
LAGLVYSDGNFNLNFTITFSLPFLPLAKYIQKRLGFGSIYQIKNKNAFTFSIGSKEGLEKVVNLVNGKLRVPFKLECIQKYLINKYKTPFNLKIPLS